MKCSPASWVLMILALSSGVRADQSAARVFWTDKDAGKLEVADLDGGNRRTLRSNLVDPRGLVVDSATNTIYWASHAPSGAIRRMECNGNNPQVLLSGISDPADLALDRENGVLYWAEQGANRIRRVSLGPLGIPETVIDGLNEPYYIAIDPTAGYLYWSDFDSKIIHRSTIDGAGSVDFITDQARVRDLALADGMIYWGDRDSSEIRRRSIAGSGTGTILFSGAADSLDRPHGLVLDPARGRMFWTDTATDEINTAAMDGSGTVTSLVTTGLVGAWGIALSEPVPTPYESWLELFFTAAEMGNPANEAILWGESADPDGDGRLNLLEFAQGTNPIEAVPNPEALQVSIGEDGGEQSLQIVYRIRKDDPGLVQFVEASTTLIPGSWQTGQFAEVPPRTVDPGNSAYEFVTMRSGTIDASNSVLFARLRVSR